MMKSVQPGEIMKTREKGDRVNPITNEVISYKEFAKSRQKYVYTQYPLTSFGKEEEEEKVKESVKQKLRKWYNNVKKPNKKVVNDYKLLNGSKNKLSSWKI